VKRVIQNLAVTTLVALVSSLSLWAGEHDRGSAHPSLPGASPAARNEHTVAVLVVYPDRGTYSVGFTRTARPLPSLLDSRRTEPALSKSLSTLPIRALVTNLKAHGGVLSIPPEEWSEIE